MNCLSWNCRVLRNSRAVRRLKDLIRRESPNFIFLMQIRLYPHEMEAVKVKLNFSNCLYVNPVGRAGGLAMLCKDELNAIVKSYFCNHIDMIIGDEGSMDSSRLTGIYGQPETHRRGETWTLICMLHEQMNKQWVCLGDFNEILQLTKKMLGWYEGWMTDGPLSVRPIGEWADGHDM
ncbi:Exo_endo_phos domain-containing protein [Cephalotus follicularis]|uniref:Exo_endo_phos domain-containing protein n=1 Tax=Cephalotus follicularis TaxID=3775 RepID=A0A1Q3AWE9_CEPFO|nr:Exo_endo_phos domain-containing protein [Cephalotus follicularis]